LWLKIHQIARTQYDCDCSWGPDSVRGTGHCQQPRASVALPVQLRAHLHAARRPRCRGTAMAMGRRALARNIGHESAAPKADRHV
jgi:hypothetical protein